MALPSNSPIVRNPCVSIFIVLVLFTVIAASAAHPAEAPKRSFDLPAGFAEQTLKRFSEQSGMEVLVPTAVVKNIRTLSVRGEMTSREALDRMLSGTALVALPDEKTRIVTVRREDSVAAAEKTGRDSAHETAGDNSGDSQKKNETKTPQTQEPMKRNKLLTTLAAVFGLLAAPVDAQTAPSGASPTSPAENTDEVIELTPFEVTSSQDVGYLAANTLAGSRLNTPLKDTAASISVITREFIDDLAATDLEDALVFANNLQINNADEGSFGDNPAGNNLTQSNQTYRVRGIRAQVARNYFRWDLPADTYNVGRIEDSRGPNSVLFGIGSAGGVINVATKQAQLKQPIRAVTLAFDDNDSKRVTLDLNQPLGDNGAIRVNAVWNEKRYAMHHVFSESKNVHLAAKYRFTPKWQIRAEYENGDLESSRGRNTGTFDFVTGWLEAGRPTFERTAPNSAFTGLGTRLGNNQPRYISNSSQLINMTGQIATSGSGLPIVDQTIAGYSIGSGGPGHARVNPFSTFSVFLEGQLGEKSAVEIGFNHQEYEWEGYDSFLSHRLFGDANTALPGTLGPNPHAGALYMESQWRQSIREENSDIARITFSTEFDGGKWGNYRAAVLGEYEEAERQSGNRFERWEGAPFHSNPIASANRVTRRTYIQEGNWESYWVDGPRLSGLLQNVTDPITGRTLSSTFSYPQSVNDDPSEQLSALLGLQASWFDGRLVAGTGYREDRISIHNFGQKRDAEGRFVIDYDNVDEVDATGRTYTLGLVGHVNKYVSLLYNMASNVNTPNATLSVLPDLSLAGAPEGIGQDYGVAFELPNQRLYMRIVRFTTASQGELRGGTSGNGHVNRNNAILDALQTANLISAADYDARYFFDTKGGFVAETLDRETKGFEVSLTGNPTPNWRLSVNYSLTEGAEENIIAEVLPWWADARAFYVTFPQETPLANGVETVGTEIQEEDDYIANIRSVEGVGIIGNRKHKVNFFTRYTFSSGMLKGAYVGGGYRYQGRMLVGRAADDSLLYSPHYGEATFLAGYSIRFKDRRRMSVQLNVANLFDETDPIVTRYATSGNLNHPRRMIIREPRSVRVTASFSF